MQQALADVPVRFTYALHVRVAHYVGASVARVGFVRAMLVHLLRLELRCCLRSPSPSRVLNYPKWYRASHPF